MDYYAFPARRFRFIQIRHVLYPVRPCAKLRESISGFYQLIYRLTAVKLYAGIFFRKLLHRLVQSFRVLQAIPVEIHFVADDPHRLYILCKVLIVIAAQQNDIWRDIHYPFQHLGVLWPLIYIIPGTYQSVTVL